MCGIAALVYGDDAAAPADATRAVLEFATRCGLERRGPDGLDAAVPAPRVALAASVLRMRRTDDWRQPVVDGRGNALAWNGEWFDGDGAAAGAGDTLGSQKCSGAPSRASRTRRTRRRPWRRSSRAASAGPTRSRSTPRTPALLFCRDPLGARSPRSPAERAFGVASAVPRGAAGWAEVPTDGVRSRRGARAPRPATRARIDLVNVAFGETGRAEADAAPDRAAGRATARELRAPACPAAKFRLCGVCCRRPVRAPARRACAHPPRRTREERAAAARPRRRRRARRRRPGARRRRRARGASCSAWARTSSSLATRHRTAYARGGAPALAAELDGDLVRLASRNLGRDDRVVSHHGREARFPYLDEAVLAVVRGELGPAVADLDEPPGVGAKRVLRDVAADLGLPRVATLVKRALQFGTRIAPFSNRLCFGSNRKGDGTAAFDVDLLLARIEGVGVS
ncbi:glutamine-hydrolyzing asparagine synthase [Aureococcus anophagefferens]|uniref:Glutamine-hydrolyzing asparagine synthase n=1 Tax=Aureococcus anophagefferens TaxID=44056 RepID=A0ABR1G799_AURAN